jgi:hypothetical protein
MATALATVAGLAAGLYGTVYGLCFAAVSGTLEGVLSCVLYFAVAGAAAGAIVGAFGTLIGGDPVEAAVPAPKQQTGQAAAGETARKSTVRVWTEQEDESELFSTTLPGSSREAIDRKDRPWT